MDIERGSLASLDRKLLAGLGHDKRFQMVRVPVSAAMWSTWKRYCELVGVSMGRAIAEMIDTELAAVAGTSVEGTVSRLEQAEQRLAAREETLAGRERMLEEAEARQRALREELRRAEQDLDVRESNLEATARMVVGPVSTSGKVGRNERCPCGSGAKFKRCHGTPPGRLRQPLRNHDGST